MKIRIITILVGSWCVANAFDSPEHDYIGNSISLSDSSGSTIKGQSFPLKIADGTILSYGEVNYLAGDFLASMNIQITNEQQFMASFNVLYQNQNQAIAKIKTVVQGIELRDRQEIEAGKPLTSNLADEVAYQNATSGMYLPLIMGASDINHFGEDALSVYRIGHNLALSKAAEAGLSTQPATRESLLNNAYLINGYADHYLQDAFASGHARTPRKQLTDFCRIQFADKRLQQSNQEYIALLMDNLPLFKEYYTAVIKVSPLLVPDLFSLLLMKAMHDEDGLAGLLVNNHQDPKPYMAYGDDLMFIADNQTNQKNLTQAVQNSTQEVYSAFINKNSQVSDSVSPLLPEFASINNLNLSKMPLIRIQANTNSLEYRDDDKEANYQDFDCAKAVWDLKKKIF